MSCHEPFGMDFVNTTFPKVWVRGEYARHMQQILLDRELVQMPTSQHLVEHYRIAQDIKKRIHDIAIERQELRYRLRSLDIERWNANHRIDRIERSGYDEDGLQGAREAVHIRREFVRKCPVDGCRGFLSSSLKCGVCNVRACADCWQPLGEGEHVCNENEVQTARLLQRETRPCPRCGIRISKIEGCNQMWCTHCNAAFLWHTGAPVIGPIHNPHYFQYLRQTSQGEQQQQNNQGNEPISIQELDRRLREPSSGRILPEYEPVMAYWRHLLHLRYDYLRRFAHPNRPYSTRDLRLAYLLGNISVDQLKQALWKREVKYTRELALRACYDAKVTEGMAVMQQFFRAEITPRTLLENLLETHTRVNVELRRVASKYTGFVDYGPRDSVLVPVYAT